MMLADLTDPEVALLYDGSDPETRTGFNIIKMNRFLGLIDRLTAANHDPSDVFEFVEKRMASIYVSNLIEQVANDG